MDTETIRQVTSFCITLLIYGVVVYWGISIVNLLGQLVYLGLKIHNELVKMNERNKDA